MKNFRYYNTLEQGKIIELEKDIQHLKKSVMELCTICKSFVTEKQVNELLNKKENN